MSYQGILEPEVDVPMMITADKDRTQSELVAAQGMKFIRLNFWMSNLNFL
jgi:hypothetical protein